MISGLIGNSFAISLLSMICRMPLKILLMSLVRTGSRMKDGLCSLSSLLKTSWCSTRRSSCRRLCPLKKPSFSGGSSGDQNSAKTCRTSTGSPQLLTSARVAVSSFLLNESIMSLMTCMQTTSTLLKPTVRISFSRCHFGSSRSSSNACTSKSWSPQSSFVCRRSSSSRSCVSLRGCISTMRTRRWRASAQTASSALRASTSCTSAQSSGYSTSSSAFWMMRWRTVFHPPGTTYTSSWACASTWQYSFCRWSQIGSAAISLLISASVISIATTLNSSVATFPTPFALSFLLAMMRCCAWMQR
mmetsp:Transcript_96689/g.255349  ORF Transcript_96689/g.255349 Transcript_96689/m.255349 type:complete len:302 (+) Transcript_96689:41-946(+)